MPPFRTELWDEDPASLLTPPELEWCQQVDNPWMAHILASEEARVLELLAKIKEYVEKHGRQHRRIRWNDRDADFEPLFDLRLDVALYARARASAKRSGHLWNPLLDALLVHGLSPVVPHRDETGRIRSYGRVPDAFGEQERQLREWLAVEQNPRSIEQLLSFHSESVAEFVAAHARAWDSQLVRSFLTRHPRYAEMLAKNPALAGWGGPEIIRWALKSLHCGSVQEGWAWRLDPGTYALHEIRQAGHLPEAADPLPHLVKLVCEAPIEEDMKALGGERERLADQGWAKAGVLLLEYANELSSKELEAVYFSVREVPELAARLLAVEGATLKMMRDAAGGPLLSHVKEMLIAHPRARRDPVVREGLASSKDGEILLRLLGQAKGEEFQRCFRALGGVEEQYLQQAIVRHQRKILSYLEPTDLAAVLASKSANLRLWATRMVGTLQEAMRSRGERNVVPKKGGEQAPPRKRGR